MIGRYPETWKYNLENKMFSVDKYIIKLELIVCPVVCIYVRRCDNTNKMIASSNGFYPNTSMFTHVLYF